MVKTKAATVLILVSMIVASFASNPVWAGEGENGSTILSEADRGFLSVTCDLAEVITVYEKYAAKISAAQKETQPTPTETTPQITPDIAQVQVSEDETAAQLDQLKQEIQAIVEKCFTKELENLKCPTKACDAGTFLPQARKINRDYFLYTQLPVRLSEQNLDQLFKKVKECLEKLFKDCGCDVECLKCLLNAIYSDSDYVRLANSYGYSNVADFMLERSGRLDTAIDFPMYMGEDDELVERIIGKLKECGYQPKPKPGTIETEIPTEVKTETTDTGIPIPIPEGTKHLPETEKPAEDKEAVVKEAEEAFKQLDKLLEEAKEKELKKQAEVANETVGDKEAEEAFKKLDELLEDARWREEEAGDKNESAFRLPRVTVTLPGEDELTEDEEAFGLMDFYTLAPSIDVSMFKVITENTEAEVKIKAPITDETSGIAREITIEVIDSEVILKNEGTEAKSKLPLIVKENKLYAGQDDILYPISLLPGDIVSGLEIAPEEISLESDENETPVYKVCLEEEARFIFSQLKLTREVEVDSASGEVLNIDQPWWGFLVSKSDIPVVFVALPTAPEPHNPSGPYGR